MRDPCRPVRFCTLHATLRGLRSMARTVFLDTQPCTAARPLSLYSVLRTWPCHGSSAELRQNANVPRFPDQHSLSQYGWDAGERPWTRTHRTLLCCARLVHILTGVLSLLVVHPALRGTLWENGVCSRATSVCGSQGRAQKRKGQHTLRGRCTRPTDDQEPRLRGSICCSITGLLPRRSAFLARCARRAKSASSLPRGRVKSRSEQRANHAHDGGGKPDETTFHFYGTLRGFFYAHSLCPVLSSNASSSVLPSQFFRDRGTATFVGAERDTTRQPCSG